MAHCGLDRQAMDGVSDRALTHCAICPTHISPSFGATAACHEPKYLYGGSVAENPGGGASSLAKAILCRSCAAGTGEASAEADWRMASARLWLVPVALSVNRNGY